MQVKRSGQTRVAHARRQGRVITPTWLSLSDKSRFVANVQSTVCDNQHASVNKAFKNKPYLCLKDDKTKTKIKLNYHPWLKPWNFSFVPK